MERGDVIDEKLIKSVKKFPCTWDTSSEFYKCIDTKDAAWDQIVIESNISDVKIAKARWKQLRDNHRDALKRQNASRSGQARKQRKVWKHQNAMSFLLPFMSNRDRSSNFAPSNPLNSIEESSRESNNLLPSSSNNLPSDNVSDDSTASRYLPSTSKIRKNDEILHLFKQNQERREFLERGQIEINNMMPTIDKYEPCYLQLQIKKTCFNAVMSAEESNLQQCSLRSGGQAALGACSPKRSESAER